jgi:intracellular sulfur oxidation DsrE/DsrF family protein
MKNLLAVLTAAGLTLTAGMGAAVAADKEHKVVYHLNSSDMKHHNAFLGNVQNHINAVGKEKLDLRVVMHGDGVEILRHARSDEGIKTKIDNLKLQGVHFNVCANTLKGRKIDQKKDLYDVTDNDVVPSGVAEIAILQGKGYAYVKP